MSEFNIGSSELGEGEWETLLSSLHRQEIVIFLGAGASMGFGEVGLPTAGELAEQLAKVCEYPRGDKTDFLRVCQYYEIWSDPEALRYAISDRLNLNGVQPSELHRTLATLPLPHILTTNYDNLMETAFEAAGKQPTVGIHDISNNINSDIPKGSENQPVVYKLHGSIDECATMICTEDDVIQFLAGILEGDKKLPDSISILFSTRKFLFIGYGLGDWNIRVLLRAMRNTKSNKKSRKRSFAIQKRSRDVLPLEWKNGVKYWEGKENILCIDMDALEFVIELKRRYEKYKEKMTRRPAA